MRQRAAASLLYQSQHAEPAFRNLLKSIFLKIVGRILAFYILCLALQPMKAQKSETADNFKYHKAVEILDEGGDPAEARKLASENIKENPKHIDSYLLIAN